MLSAQIDELRTMAAMFVVKGVPEVASVIRDAADTIWQLREDLQGTNTENAKLREFANEMFKEILLLPEYQMGSKRKRHFIDKGIELGLRGWA